MKPSVGLSLLIVLLHGSVLAADRVASPAKENLFEGSRVFEVRLMFDREAWTALEPIEPTRRQGVGDGIRWGPGGGPGREPERGPNPGIDPGDGRPRVGPPGLGADRAPMPMPMPMDRDYPWSRARVDWDGVVLDDVAIRYKGNSSFNGSRGGFKRPFKLDFNRGHKGRTLLGMEELMLNNNVNDATQVREALAYEVCRSAGLVAPRTAFARVALTIMGGFTNRLLGLYTVVEAVNRDFLEVHGGGSRGLLVKPERLQGLEYLGEEWAAYTNRYDPKGTVNAEDTRRLIELARLIARADDATFERELPSRLDLPVFLKYVAVTALLANYDSFVGNGHNYYLFQPSEARPALFIPWDLNEAFGGHPMAGTRVDQAELSVLRPAGSPNRLLERVLSQPAWATQYRNLLTELLAQSCEPGRLTARASALAEKVRETVSAESPQARAAFERIALGRVSDVAAPESGPPGPGFQRPMGPWSREELPLSVWIERRMRNVAEELAGQRTGTTPRTQRPGERPRPGPRPEPRDPIR